MFERVTGKWKAIYLNEISTLKPFEKNQTGCIWFSCKLLPGHIFISCSVSEIHQDIETPKELVTKARKICSRSRQLHKMWNFKSSFWCCKWCKNFMKKEKKIKTHFRTHVMMTLGSCVDTNSFVHMNTHRTFHFWTNMQVSFSHVVSLTCLDTVYLRRVLLLPRTVNQVPSNILQSVAKTADRLQYSAFLPLKVI